MTPPLLLVGYHGDDYFWCYYDDARLWRCRGDECLSLLVGCRGDSRLQVAGRFGDWCHLSLSGCYGNRLHGYRPFVEQLGSNQVIPLKITSLVSFGLARLITVSEELEGAQNIGQFQTPWIVWVG